MSRCLQFFRSGTVRRIGVTVVALVGAIALGAFVLIATGKDPIQAYSALWSGAFGSKASILATLITSTPLLIMSLGVSISFISGYFNIGAGGQMALGALASVVVGKSLNIPGPLVIPLMIIAGGIAGAVWGAIPGYLRAWRGANEIVTTLMLNYVALFLLDYLVTGPLKSSEVGSRTAEILKKARFPSLFGPDSPTIGLVIAVIGVPITWFVMRRTYLGFEMRMVGMNPDAGLAAGMSPRRVAVSALAISGFYSGVAGACLVGGVFWSVDQGFSIQLGFDAIVVALLGGLSPVGILLASIFWGGVLNGSQIMQLDAGVSQPFTLVLEAFVLIALVVVPWFLKRRQGSRVIINSFRRRQTSQINAVKS